MQLDEEALGVRAAFGIADTLKQGPQWQRIDDRVQPPQMNIALRAELERTVGDSEGCNFVLVGLTVDRFIFRSIAQAHEQFLAAITHDGCSSGGGDGGVGGIGDIGHEDLVPIGWTGPGVNILHVEDKVAKILVEHTGLDLVRSLRGFKGLFHLQDGLIGARGQIE